MTYEELRAALALFGLPERATLRQLKTRHRELLRRHHPDAAGEGGAEAIRQVNAAYRLLEAYCRNYRFCFSREEFLEQNPEERLREQFSQDPVWGGKG